MAALGAGLAAVHSEHIFNVFISLQLPARLVPGRDRKGSAGGQGQSGDGSWWQGLSPSPGRGPGRASGKGGGWIQSLSFTWAGVQPRNSCPKTRSHERKKIARRRIIHPYFLVLCGCRAGGASHGRGRSAPLRPGWTRRLPGARAQLREPARPRGSRGGPGCDPGRSCLAPGGGARGSVTPAHPCPPPSRSAVLPPAVPSAQPRTPGPSSGECLCQHPAPPTLAQRHTFPGALQSFLAGFAARSWFLNS